MLGSTTGVNQERAWIAGGQFGKHPTCEDEPSLGWSDGRGHPQAAMPGYDDDREEQHDLEWDPAEQGVGDSDGMAEQMALFMGCGYVE